MPGIKSYIGHRVRELYVNVDRWRQPTRHRRVMVFPSYADDGGSSDVRGVAVGRKLRQFGWRVTVVPAQLEWSQRQRLIRSERPDVILLQQSRHPLNRPRLYPGIPCVFDVDDADICDPRTRDEAIECGCESQAIIVSNQFLGSLFSQYNKSVHVVWTSTYLCPLPKHPSLRSRGPVVVWAQLDATSWSHESEFVREVIGKLSNRSAVRFLLIGEADRAAADQYVRPLCNLGVECKVLGRLRYKRYVSALSQAAVGLNPSTTQASYSRGRSFGKVLGYMIARVPIVTANNPDYSQFFEHRVNALIAGETDVATWVEYCRELLEDEALRDRLSDRAVENLRDRLSTTRAAQAVDRILREVLIQQR